MPVVEIDSLSPPQVNVSWGDYTPFKIIGRGFSKKKITAYVSTNEYGNDVVPKINVTIDPDATSTDSFLSMIAYAETGAETGRVFWVAVKLDDVFQDAQEGLTVF